MRAKPILTIVLGVFVAAALIVVARQSTAPGPGSQGGGSVAAPVDTKVQVQSAAVAAVPPTAAIAPGVAASAPAPTNESPRVARSTDDPKPSAARAETQARAASSPVAHKVVAMYFHGNVRCATCRKVEAYAREAVEAGFAPQLASGVVEFRAVNVEQAGNRHFIEDYQLVNKSVVVVDEVDGAVRRWVKLDNVWGLVGNRDAYLQYVQDAVRSYVEDP